jgi:hypothetical protein
MVGSMKVKMGRIGLDVCGPLHPHVLVGPSLEAPLKSTDIRVLLGSDAAGRYVCKRTGSNHTWSSR